MKNNKIFAAAAALVMVFSLAACNNAQNDTSSKSETNSAASSPLESMVISAASSAKNEESSAAQNAPESTGGVPQISAGTTSTDTSYTPPNNGQGGEVSGSILVLDGGRGIMLYGIGYGPGRNYAATVTCVGMTMEYTLTYSPSSSLYLLTVAA